MPRTIPHLSQRPFFTFYGAADSVSGSMHLVDTGRSKILLDCGKSFGQKESTAVRPGTRLGRFGARGGKSRQDEEVEFPFSPSDIDLVLISHAHIDHCGSLPLLVKQGFRGNILCTHSTLDLLEIVLYDVARIHERELERTSYYSGSRRGRSREREFSDSQFVSYDDVDATLRLFQGVDYNEPLQPLPDAKIRMHNSAHVLGSSMIEMEIANAEVGSRSLVFTGDLGRFHFPFIGTPAPIPDCDLVVCESTYGNRFHEPFDVTLAKLAELINQTIEGGGKALIPAFSLGRTNFLKCCLLELIRNKAIPNVPICIDSPLASQFDYVYREFGNDGLLTVSESDSETDSIEWLESGDEAWWRTTCKEPCIIIASGGMCEGGRIMDHLRYHIDDPRDCLILVSYQAPDSLGAELLSNTPRIWFQGRFWNKWIRVEQIQGFSAHGDQTDLTRLLESVNPDRQICLVHGETDAKIAFRDHLASKGFSNVTIPSLFDSVEI